MKTTIQETIEECLTEDEEITLADGFERAFVGIARQFGKPFAVYDRGLCLSILTQQEMTYEEAEEYMAFNTEGAWIGENTPAFMCFAKTDEEQRIEKFTSALAQLLHASQLLEGQCDVLKDAIEHVGGVLEKVVILHPGVSNLVTGVGEALQLVNEIRNAKPL